MSYLEGVALKEHPFATGLVVGVVGLLAYWKRHAIASFFRATATKIRHPLSGFANAVPAGSPGAPAVRHVERYAFASLQDQSPIVGLTHASYALNSLDLIEETLGRDAIARAGFDPTMVRALITGLQDRHASALRGADPYVRQVLALKAGGGLEGFVNPGAAPMGG